MGPYPTFAAEVTDLGTSQPVVAVRGEIDLLTVPILAEAFSRVLRQSTSDVVLDLSETTFMDCSGICAILAARNQMPENSKIILREPLPQIQRILAILEMDSVCVIESRVA